MTSFDMMIPPHPLFGQVSKHTDLPRFEIPKSKPKPSSTAADSNALHRSRCKVTRETATNCFTPEFEIPPCFAFRQAPGQKKEQKRKAKYPAYLPLLLRCTPLLSARLKLSINQPRNMIFRGGSNDLIFQLAILKQKQRGDTPYVVPT